jgi:Domain of unknown function (DUF5615)
MSRPRFLADHDLNDVIIKGTTRREPAIEFARLWDFGLERHSDQEILKFAARESWIVVSHDVNSMTAAASEILGDSEPMHGLLLVHQGDPIAPAIDDLLLIWTATEAEEWIGRIEYLPL